MAQEETQVAEETTEQTDTQTDTATTETADTETADTETADTETADTETADTETADTETADTQSSENDSADTSTEAAANQPELNESLSNASNAAGASQEAEAERVEVENGRAYEFIFIVRVGESTDEATQRVRAIIEESGGAVDNVRVSEQRRLAYPIKKEIEGFYVVLNGRFSKEAAAELDRAVGLDEAVLRHMIIREDEE